MYYKNIKNLSLVGLFIIITGCDKKIDMGVFSRGDVCAATVATVMEKNPSIISIDTVTSEEIYLSYIRADDKSKWNYKCKIDGSSVIWGSHPGRWRVDNVDPKNEFHVEGDFLKISVNYSDGSATNKSFSLQDLRN